MSKQPKYLVQEFHKGKWRTVRQFDTTEAAWRLASCLRKGRVQFKGALVERPEGLVEGEHGRSIVKRAYRLRYQSQQDTNGDTIAQQLQEYLHDASEIGPPCINRDKMEKFAQANQLWDARYADLNNGQVRMTIGNRLRAKLRNDKDFRLTWP